MASTLRRFNEYLDKFEGDDRIGKQSYLFGAMSTYISHEAASKMLQDLELLYRREGDAQRSHRNTNREGT